jgi:hypothetical protein
VREFRYYSSALTDFLREEEMNDGDGGLGDEASDAYNEDGDWGDTAVPDADDSYM